MKELFQGKKKGGRRGFFSLLCNIGHDGAPQDGRPEEEGTLVRVLLSLPLSLYALSLPSLVIVLSRGQRFRSSNFTFHFWENRSDQLLSTWTRTSAPLLSSTRCNTCSFLAQIQKGLSIGRMDSKGKRRGLQLLIVCGS